MDSEHIDNLIRRVLDGHATSGEEAALESACRQDDTVTRRLVEMRKMHQLLQEIGPVAGSMDADAPDLPEYQMHLLEEKVRAVFPGTRKSKPKGFREWFFTPVFALMAGAAAVMFLAVLFVVLPREQPPGFYVEVAMFEEIRTRGSTVSPGNLPAEAKVSEFSRPEDFEHWIEESDQFRERAPPSGLAGRILIDDAMGELVVYQFFESGESTKQRIPLPEAPEERHALLLEIIEEMMRL